MIHEWGDFSVLFAEKSPQKWIMAFEGPVGWLQWGVSDASGV
jgi:hypothetical protein